MGETSYKLTQAVKAVREGKLDSVRELISSSRLHYSEAWSQEGYVLLLEAVKHKQNYIAKLLLACGCKVNKNKSTENSNTPLHFAVLNDDIEIVEILLDRGADINAKAGRKIIDYVNDKGASYTPLHLAVETGREEIIKLLLNRGAKVNTKGRGGITPLHIAVDRNYLQIVAQLLYHGAYVNSAYTSTYRKGYTPLHLAVIYNEEEIVKLLLNKGANVNAITEFGLTALLTATNKGHKELVELLLKYGAKVDFMVNTSLLHVAVTAAHPEIVELLLNYGADIDSKDKDGKTALHIAVANSCENIVEVLLKFGADINVKDAHGSTALYIAIEKGQQKLLEIFLKGGTKIDFMINNPPLHTAVNRGHLEIVKVLLKFGADIDSKDEYGRTALHIAVANLYSYEIVKVLLKFGADIDSKNNYGRTALSIFCENYSAISDTSVLELLLKFGADSDSKDKDGKTVFHYACQSGNIYVINVLLEHGCDINVMCKNNQTPLDLACDHWSKMILENHIIKMKTANLYISRKNLLSINSGDEINYKGFQNECEKEIASMKSEKFNNVNVSFYDILTGDINQLAMYAGNESIAQILRSEDYKIKFPIYASMINSNFRKGERKREFVEQSNKIFYIFRNNFGLPQECTEEIFRYLSKKDLRNLFSAY